MLGAIIGDIVGSVYEWDNIKTKDFPLFRKDCFFTDDTVMTIAVADAIMQGKREMLGSGVSSHGGITVSEDLFIDSMKKWGRLYPYAGYGGNFRLWIQSNTREPYNSWGNGSAMRVSPCAWVCDQTQFIHECIEDVDLLATTSASVTHNHPEGIKGAVETARAIWFMLRARSFDDYPNNIDDWKDMIRKNSGYDLTRTLDEIRPTYHFNETCMDTVPQAIIAFLESTDFEDAIRNAISLGGDSDTLAAITGSIAEAAYGIPEWIKEKAWSYLDEPLREVCRKWKVLIAEKQ
ncbi:ADP-ribosylglycohydrolase family protein [Gudongella oleilytica]|uniref:ADP-ribosylglycohydrolase family protein n=1 Tax=Gudongella oleilytica TaxID=1582259 RepID=UPI000FF87CBC|nr:ADP-ribosylglycohydrolase family protein [Gudongella oleilytica]